MRQEKSRLLLAGVVGLLALGFGPRAGAQAPPPLSPEAGEIASCLCLKGTLDSSGADMSARQQAYDSSRNALADLDAGLERARGAVDVNNPQSVAEFRQLLERRDAAFRHSTGAVTADLARAVERYNQVVNEYNGRCANRPRDPRLLAQVQATLSCPPPY